MDYKEKNQQFLSWFWDLASDDRERRLGAANGILSHVDQAVKTQKGMNEEGSMVIDLDYALKRLVRGLSSSRDSARHGFASCLAALLASGAVPLKIALPIIDESTHIRGKIKGSEERDLMFGKLFAYLSIARSGLLARDAQAGLDLFKRLLELHRMRGWLREVVSEAFFVVLRAMDPAADLKEAGAGPANAVEAALEALGEEDLLRGELSEWSPWQLQLALSLQQYAGEFKGGESGDDEVADSAMPAHHKNIRKRVHGLLPSKKMDAPELVLGPLVPVLITSAAGFPKIHRVWDLLLGSVFGTSSDGSGAVLPTARSAGLGRRQEALLMALVAFIEKHLIVPSHEKRSLAFRLTVLLAKHTPVDLLPRALHKSVLRGLVAARVNRKHTLYALAGAAVHDLVSTVVPWDEATGQWVGDGAAGATSQARVALASVLVSHASANFDSLTGIPAVSTLLQGLDEESVLSHVQSLVQLVAGATDMQATETETAPDADAEEADASRSAAALATAALEALASLAKNARLSCRGTVCSVVVAVLTRISCFEEAALPAELAAGDSKKGKGKKGAKDSLASFRSSVDDANASVSTHMMQAIIAVSPDTEGRAAFPAALVASASGKLLTLLADAGHMSSVLLNSAAHAPADKEKDKKKVEDAAPSVLAQATAVAVLLSTNGIVVRTALDSSAMQVQDKEEAVDTPQPQDAFDAAGAAIQATGKQKPSALASALCALLGHASFQMLAANAELAQAVIDIATVAPDLASASGAPVEPTPEDDEQETVLDQQLGSLLDACFELVAQNEGAVRAESLSIKGVTAAIKRVWVSVGKDLPVGLGILENIVGAIVGEDGEDDADEEEAVNSGDEEEEPEEDADVEEAPDPTENKKSKKEKPAKKEKEVVTGEEEDIILDEEAALHMLATENSDDEEELANLQGMLHVAEHGEEADAALVHMLEMRKANRKAGLLEAKRKQLLVRSRAIDMLESVLSRIESAELLMPLLSPLLLCLRKIQTGLTQSLSEGRAFESRLRGFLDQRICRKKFVLSHFGDEETKEGIAEMVSGLCAQLRVDLQCPFAPMRQIAAVALICLSRSTIGGDCVAAKQGLGQFMSELLLSYFQHKKSRLTSAIFEEHFSRFADFSIPCCVAALSQGCATAVSPFLRSEASRMLQIVARRFSSLGESTRAAVRAALPSVLSHLSAALAQCSAGADVADTSAKRVKPILQCLRDVCLLPVCVGKLSDLQSLGRTVRHEEVPAKGKGKSKKTQEVEVVDIIDVVDKINSMDAALAALAQKLPALAALAQQTQAALTGVRDSKTGTTTTTTTAAVVTPKADKSGKNNKRKAVDSLEAAEQRLVAQSEAAMEEAEEVAAVKKSRSGAPWHESTTVEDTEVEQPKAKKSKKASKQ